MKRLKGVVRLLLGIGIDIVEIARITKAMEKTAFAVKFFTPAEQAYCEARKNQRFASYAARFAAKEALVKAFGQGFRYGKFTDISIENDELGCPFVRLFGHFEQLRQQCGIGKIHISLSHCKEWAVAQVILEVQG